MQSQRPKAALISTAICLAACLLLISPADLSAADDRNLFSAASEDPYLFILFDTSGSMHWTPSCDDPAGCRYACPSDSATCEQICPIHTCVGSDGIPVDKATCAPGEQEVWMCETPFCPDGDCYADLNADDPASKFFQAKSAIYEVIQQTIDEQVPINMGFATFNQDVLRVQGKHWLYQVADSENGITLEGLDKIFEPGQEQVFGRIFNCFQANYDGADNNNFTGFWPTFPAPLNVPYSMKRVGRCPQLGPDGNTASTGSNLVYLRIPVSGNVYKIEFLEVETGNYGDNTIEVEIRRSLCADANCTTTSAATEHDIDFELISDFVMWDFEAPGTNAVAASPPPLNQTQLGYFRQDPARDGLATNTCGGWDGNDDDTNDPFGGYALRFPDGALDPRGTPLETGDVIPLDWLDDQREAILDRLAPNRGLLGKPDTPPDFRVARYLNDTLGANLSLHLDTESERPLIADGSTPLGGSMADFQTWYTAWKAEANDPMDGDGVVSCRRVFLMVITDGDESCWPFRNACCNPAAIGSQLYGTNYDNPEVQTFVVAFGVDNRAGNLLNFIPHYLVGEKAHQDPDGRCVRDSDGTSLLDSNGVCRKPFYADDRQQLIDRMRSVIQSVSNRARSFATAAVPSVQATVSDKIFLSSFAPVTDSPFWDGGISAFLKPLPLDTDGRPDRTHPNFLWDAGEAVAATQVNATDPLGGAAGQRRVYYSLFNATGDVPRTRRLLEPTDDTMPLTLRNDLIFAFGLDSNGTITNTTAAEADAAAVIDEFFSLKTYFNADLGRDKDYVIGDIFHSDPVLVGNPNNSLYFALDLKDNGQDCGTASNGRPENPGYRCFALKHEKRRKMLLAGTNEGLVHAFDAGIYRDANDKFDDGSGKEIFAFTPRTVMPLIEQMTRPDANHDFTVDGRVSVTDVFIDPVNDAGALLPTDPPNADHRQWRTIAVGSLRRGGKGLYAVDITQPDTYDGDLVPQVTGTYLPTCTGGDSGTTHPVNQCGEVPFPAVLWEFDDWGNGGSPVNPTPLDEDPANGTVIPVGARGEVVVGHSDAPASNGELRGDLGETWSPVVFGRIRICTGATCDPSQPSNNVEDRFVAIFGGGYDPDRQHERGNYVYMVDTETGQTLYKRHVLGAVPGEVATVDTNFDGFIDRLYFGTTRGFLYRVDLELDPDAPTVVSYTREDVYGFSHTVKRLDETMWKPRVIFDANEPGVDTVVRGRAIFQRPTVIYQAEKVNGSNFLVTFGTGYRDDLWRTFSTADGGAQEGRFFVFADTFGPGDGSPNDGSPNTGADPLTEADLTQVSLSGGDQGIATNLIASDGGWFFQLGENERMISNPFVLSGVLIFNTYTPDPNATTVTNEDDRILCQRTGFSRVFGTFLQNGDALLPGSGSSRDRFRQIDDLVTAPYSEPGQSKNPGAGGATGGEPPCVTPDVTALLRQTQPDYCRFGSFRIDVKALQSDTGNICIVSVPICLVQKNWREF